MKSYSEFAKIYDRLMHKDVDYKKYADYIENLFDLHDVNPDLVCDMACGTGNITIPLARRGYNMTGTDRSAEMLDIARQKSTGLDILYLNQSIEKLDLYGTMGAFLCMVDGFNYIISPKVLEYALHRIRTCFIDNGGVLIFDVSSQYKLENVIGDNTFIYSEEDIFYSWRNRYIKSHNLSEMLLDFFVKDGKGYKRFEERHIQRAWSEEELRYILRRAGFGNVHTYGYLSFNSPAPDEERIVFLCKAE